MADIDDLSYEIDEVVAAEEQEDSLFENVSSIVSFVTELGRVTNIAPFHGDA